MNIKSSIKQLYHEILKYGNPYNMIKYKLIDHNTYIEYIINNKSIYTEKELLIGLFYTIKTMPNFIYEEKGLVEHFSEYPKIVKYIFLCKGISSTLEYNINIEDLIISDSVINEYYSKCVIEDKELLYMVFALKCEKMLLYLQRFMTGSEYTEYLIMTDKTDNLKEYCDTNMIMNRIEYLTEVAPNYYKMISSFYFYIIFEDVEMIQNISEDELPRIIKFFQKQLGIEGVKIDPKYYRFFTYPITYRIYLLGFNPLLEFPKEKEVKERYHKLQNTELNVFISEIIGNNNIEGNIANPQDSLFENPEEYLPFDRIDINENGKIYRFTRNEFDILLNKGYNFWTKQTITVSSVINIGIKNSVATYLRLPPAAPLEELFEKALNGCLLPYIEAEEE
jgi:hypothetical protein